MKCFVTRQVPVRENGDRRDKRQETFTPTVAVANNTPAYHHSLLAFSNVKTTKMLIIGRSVAGKIATKRDERLGTLTRAIDGPNDPLKLTIERDEHQGTFIQVVVGENYVPASNVETFMQSATGAISTPAVRVKETKDLVVGQGVRRNAGAKGNKCQQMFAQGVASADCVPEPCRPLLEPNSVEETRHSAVGQVPTRGDGIRMNECQGTFVHTVAGASKAPALRRPSLEMDNIEWRKLVVEQVPVGGTNVWECSPEQ
jgi:hypothetical protein